MTTLSDVCTHIVDCKNRTAPADENGEYFAVGTPAMRGNKINLSEARMINAEVFDEWTSRLRPQAGDLLLAREAPVGPVVLIPDGGNIAAGQRTTLLRVDSTLADAIFLRHYLTSDSVQARLLAGAHGSTTPHLRVDDIRRFEVDLPPLPIQKSIADVLGALDEKIAANDRFAAKAEAVLRAEVDLMWLTRDGRSTSISEYLELNPSVPPPRLDSAIYIDMKRLPESGWSIDGFDMRAPKGGARFLNGDTLLARITPCLENRKTGYVDHLESGQVGVGSTEFIVLRSRPHIAAPLSFLLATAPRFRDFAIQQMVGTSGRQRVAASDLAEYQIPKPDAAWLEDFGHRAIGLFETVASQAQENRILAATRDALLPQLMSGKLRVRDAEAIAADAGA